MAFSFSKLLTDIIAFPSKPGSGALARKQFQDMFDEVAVAINANHKFKGTIITRAINTAGVQAVTLGFQPSFVTVRAFYTGTNYVYSDCDGFYDGVSQTCLLKYANAGSIPIIRDKFLEVHDGNNANDAACAFTPTGITLNWTIAGALPAGNMLMLIKAWA